ncbi:hypothetical protein [Acidiplasma sp.]|nr:hypothetical protein [Acidiplasma sp.]
MADTSVFPRPVGRTSRRFDERAFLYASIWYGLGSIPENTG